MLVGHGTFPLQFARVFPICPWSWTVFPQLRRKVKSAGRKKDGLHVARVRESPEARFAPILSMTSLPMSWCTMMELCASFCHMDCVHGTSAGPTAPPGTPAGCSEGKLLPHIMPRMLCGVVNRSDHTVSLNTKPPLPRNLGNLHELARR